MKHLRRFDEELKPATYRSAGERLIRRFKEKRGAKLVDYGNEKEFGFYNMYFANSNGKIGPQTDMVFTNPKAEFYFQGHFSFDNNGNPEIQNKNAEDLVRNWKQGDELAFIITFRFSATENTKIIGNHSTLKSKVVPMFSFKVMLSDWNDGIEEWNIDEDTGETMIGTDGEYDTYDMFVNSFFPSISLGKPFDKNYFGIFRDRASAFKFKKELPKLIEPFEEHIHDIISVIGGDSEHIEKIMNLFNKITLNGLYDDNNQAKVNNGDYSTRWFNNNTLAH